MALPGDGSALESGFGGASGGECEPGEVEDCSVELGTHNGVHSCVTGERVCRGGAWGACEGTLTARFDVGDGSGGGTAGGQPVDDTAGDDAAADEPMANERQFDDTARRVLTTATVDCQDACDPQCEAFPDIVPGTATPASTPTAPPIVGGSRLSFQQLVPSAFQRSLLKSPCTGITGACQTDTRCVANTCTPWEEDEYRVVSGVDLTVGLPCGDGATAKIPVCNRGDVASQGGTKLAFLTSNSSQLQNDLSRCTLASNRSFSHECTIPDVIQPGQCVMSPASCAPGLHGNNKALLINPSRAAPNTVVAQAEGAGRCGNNWSWWDTAVTCDVCTPATQSVAVVRTGGACATAVFGSIPGDLLTERMVIGSARKTTTETWTKLSRVQDAQGCDGSDQYWIDETQPTVTSYLCPKTCDWFAGATAPQLKMAVQCPVTYDASLTGTTTFEAACPPGTRAQWGYLAYNAFVPGDSELDIDVRSSPTETFSGAYHDVAKVTTLDDLLDPPRLDTAACLATDPDGDCPISLWTELDGAPEATNPFLEVRWTILRSTNTRLAPQLHSIETTFTCPWTE